MKAKRRSVVPPDGSGMGSGPRSTLPPRVDFGTVGSPSTITSRASRPPASAVPGAGYQGVTLGKGRRDTSSGSPPVPFTNRTSSVPSVVATVTTAEAPATAGVDPAERRRHPASRRVRGEASPRTGSWRGGRRSPPRPHPARRGGSAGSASPAAWTAAGGATWARAVSGTRSSAAWTRRAADKVRPRGTECSVRGSWRRRRASPVHHTAPAAPRC